ncbi:MAG: hypothetical protein ACLUEK_01685 [Oscillospiraceae bacterium]
MNLAALFEYLALTGTEGVVELNTYVAAGAEELGYCQHDLIAVFKLPADVGLGVVEEHVVDDGRIAGQVGDHVFYMLHLIGVGRVCGKEHICGTPDLVFLIGYVAFQVGTHDIFGVYVILDSISSRGFSCGDLEIIYHLFEICSYSEGHRTGVAYVSAELCGNLVTEYTAGVLFVAMDNGCVSER